MDRKTLSFEVCPDGRSITVPFDNGDAGNYEIEFFPDHGEADDGVILVADRRACRAFAEIFAQLGNGHYPEGYHVHLGWDESDAVGVKIVLGGEGRIVRAEDLEED